MNNLFKSFISFFVIFLLFKLGYNKAYQKTSNAFSQNSMHPRSWSSPSRLLPTRPVMGKANFLLNGLPADIDMYTSKISIAKEASKFEREWRARGYEPVTQSIGNMKIVSAFDENKKLLQSAIVLPDPISQKTMVISSRLDLSKPPLNKNPQTPLYPQSQTLFHLESNDFGGSSENLILMTDASVATVMNYYTSQFNREGWQIADQPGSPFNPNNSDMRLFLKGADERWLSASKMGSENKTVIFLLYNDKY